MSQKIDYSAYKDRDLSGLSEREKQIMSLKIENPSLSCGEIGKKIGISVTNTSTLLYNARAKLDGNYVAEKNKAEKTARINLFDLVHGLGAGFDTSNLSDRELKLFNIVLNAPRSLSREEMANKMGIKRANIGAAVYHLRLKIDKNYAELYKKRKEKLQKYRKAQGEKISEYNRKYHMEHREEILQKQKEINKDYYIANRERILEKSRQKAHKRKNSTTP